MTQKTGALADADRWLQAAVAATIEANRRLTPKHTWQPGDTLKLLFAGYSGTRNTGADIRVEEMIRQFMHIIGEDVFEPSVLTIDPDKSRRYFPGARQVRLPKVYPAFLMQQLRAHHGVVTCEGSMFKSKFADALSTMMVGALGLALAEHKPAIGYGGEAGAMSPGLEGLIRRYIDQAFVLTRNTASTEILSRLGVPAETGTDTAWTFEPASQDKAAALMRDRGMDPDAPTLAICPINPFWWPVRPSLPKAAAYQALGLYADAHYASVYFHNHGPEVAKAQNAYIRAIARSASAFAERHGYQVALIAMEALDTGACHQLAGEMTVGTTVLSSQDIDAYELVAVLRRCKLLVSSRYHALVTSSAGGVPGIGVTMDERIPNLFAERGQRDLCLRVDDPNLEDALAQKLTFAREQAESIASANRASVVRHLQVMGQMGRSMLGYLQSQLHGFHPARELGEDPWAYLPPLSEPLRQLVRDHGGRDLAQVA